MQSLPRTRLLTTSGLCAIASLTAPQLPSGSEQPKQMEVAGTIHFDGTGTVYVDLVTRDDFDASTPVEPFLAVLEPGPEELASKRVSFAFEGVSPGTYAVRAFLDQNENGVLDSYLLGPPKEPWGLYRPNRPRMMRPRFEDSAFELADDETEIQITLR